MAKTTYRISYAKKNRSRKNGDKDSKFCYKLMDNAVYDKIMENVRNRINVRLASNEKDYFKWISKPCYMSQKYLTSIWLLFTKTKLR